MRADLKAIFGWCRNSNPGARAGDLVGLATLFREALREERRRLTGRKAAMGRTSAATPPRPRAPSGTRATVAFRCICFARTRTGPRAVAALDAATVVTCAARPGTLSSSTSPDSENPPSVLGSVKFFQILVALFLRPSRIESADPGSQTVPFAPDERACQRTPRLRTRDRAQNQPALEKERGCRFR